MNRFQSTPDKSGILRRFFPIFIFCIVIVVFMISITSVSENTAQQEAMELENSIRKSAIHCYALEGFYPENIAYLEDNYGVSYNHDAYVVSYEVIGENIMPDITIIPKNKKGEIK